MAHNRIALRITAQDREFLDKVCEARGEDLSDFVRRAIKKELAGLSFYSEDTKKALGISPKGSDV